jgi:hypothetical protein
VADLNTRTIQIIWDNFEERRKHGCGLSGTFNQKERKSRAAV